LSNATRGAWRAGDPTLGRGPSNDPHHVHRVHGEKLLERVGAPGFRVAVLAVAQGHGDDPEVVKHVDHIEHEGDLDLARASLCPNVRELMFVAVDEHDGDSLAVWQLKWNKVR
jgi:hypothetical protein